MYESRYLKKLIYAKPYLLLLLVFSFLAIFGIKSSGAADATITCADAGCSGISGPLFSETNLAPGVSVTKTLKAENNYAEDRDFLIQVESASFSDDTPSMGDVLRITVTEQESSTLVYGPKTLSQFKDDGETALSSVPAGGVRSYEFEVTLDNVDNDYQGKSLAFDLKLGFEAMAEAEGTTSTASEGEVLGVSSESVGSVLGLSDTGAGIVIWLITILGALSILAGTLILARVFLRAGSSQEIYKR